MRSDILFEFILILLSLLAELPCEASLFVGSKCHLNISAIVLALYCILVQMFAGRAFTFQTGPFESILSWTTRADETWDFLRPSDLGSGKAERLSSWYQAVGNGGLEGLRFHGGVVVEWEGVYKVYVAVGVSKRSKTHLHRSGPSNSPLHAGLGWGFNEFKSSWGFHHVLAIFIVASNSNACSKTSMVGVCWGNLNTDQSFQPLFQEKLMTMSSLLHEMQLSSDPKPWLFRVYRWLYYPVMWGIIINNYKL